MVEATDASMELAAEAPAGGVQPAGESAAQAVAQAVEPSPQPVGPTEVAVPEAAAQPLKEEAQPAAERAPAADEPAADGAAAQPGLSAGAGGDPTQPPPDAPALPAGVAAGLTRVAAAAARALEAAAANGPELDSGAVARPVAAAAAAQTPPTHADAPGAPVAPRPTGPAAPASHPEPSLPAPASLAGPVLELARAAAAFSAAADAAAGPLPHVGEMQALPIRLVLGGLAAGDPGRRLGLLRLALAELAAPLHGLAVALDPGVFAPEPRGALGTIGAAVEPHLPAWPLRGLREREATPRVDERRPGVARRAAQAASSGTPANSGGGGSMHGGGTARAAAGGTTRGVSPQRGPAAGGRRTPPPASLAALARLAEILVERPGAAPGSEFARGGAATSRARTGERAAAAAAVAAGVAAPAIASSAHAGDGGLLYHLSGHGRDHPDSLAKHDVLSGLGLFPLPPQSHGSAARVGALRDVMHSARLRAVESAAAAHLPSGAGSDAVFDLAQSWRVGLIPHAGLGDAAREGGRAGRYGGGSGRGEREAHSGEQGAGGQGPQRRRAQAAVGGDGDRGGGGLERERHPQVRAPCVAVPFAGLACMGASRVRARDGSLGMG